MELLEAHPLLATATAATGAGFPTAVPVADWWGPGSVVHIVAYADGFVLCDAVLREMRDAVRKAASAAAGAADDAAGASAGAGSGSCHGLSKCQMDTLGQCQHKVLLDQGQLCGAKALAQKSDILLPRTAGVTAAASSEGVGSTRKSIHRIHS